MSLIGVAAISCHSLSHGCLGKGDKIPWHCKEDLQHFKKLTAGGTVVMGRKTWDSLPKRPLPNRHNVVLTKTISKMDGCICSSIHELPSILHSLPSPHFVIGGAQTFDSLRDHISLFHVTLVNEEVPGGDVFMPSWLFRDFCISKETELSQKCKVAEYVRTQPHRVAIALGSNLGDRASLIRQAIAMVSFRGENIEVVSDLIETDPVGGPDGQGQYLNAVAILRTAKTSIELLNDLLSIEKELGRVRSGLRNAPRPIDLDILLYDDLVISSPELEIPHPRMHQRQFVLDPLKQVAPDWIHPVLQMSIQDLNIKHLPA